MLERIDYLKNAKIIISMLREGIDPDTNEEIKDLTFLKSQRVINCFSFINEVLTEQIENPKKLKNTKIEFSISQDVLNKIIFPNGLVGISKIVNAINRYVDDPNMKKLTARMVNERLKHIGILTEIVDKDGYKSTVTNESSEDYGIFSKKKKLRDREYLQVLYTEKGKEFLRENLIELINFKDK